MSHEEENRRSRNRKPNAFRRLGGCHVDKYEAWFEKNRSAYQSELEAVRALLPVDGKGIEVGVGTGRFAAFLGVSVGVDPSRAMSEIARNRGIDVIGGVAEFLPFKDAKFDFVLMVTIDCFLDDVVAAFREARRVLKLGGSLVVGFVDRNSPLGARYEKNKDKSTFYRSINFHSVEDISVFLKISGFKDQTFVQTIFRDPEEMKYLDSVKKGHGQGSFVVARGLKSTTPS
ncbi:MAG: class I SAM-dependent methyltransferase [Methanotrichaceae archaeon]